jgi:K+-sensing histidine kinase KdpD
VFDMFHSVRRGDQAPGPGSASTISQGIVRAHGGTSKGATRGGTGCTIHIELPLSEPPAKRPGED